MARSKNSNPLLDAETFGEKTFTLSATGLRLVAATFGVLLIFTAVMTWGFLYYRSKGFGAANESIALLEREKAELISKIGSLEGTIQRIEKFTEKLEASVGVESGKLSLGVGPVSEQEDLGEFLNRVHKMPSLTSKSLAKDWRAGKYDDQFYQKMTLKLDELSEFASNLELRVNDVYEASEDRISFWASTPSLWPVHGWITSNFGYRFSPWGTGVKMHAGIDIASSVGTPVTAPADGTVLFAGQKGGYGNAVVIDHGYGISTLYGHASQLFVTEGEHVSRGTKIAAVGSTGSSTGPHLHYEVHVDGIPTDPTKYILEPQ